MDWSKAKTILIIAFIITNLILLAVINDRNPYSDATLDPDFIDKVTSLLEEKNIRVDGEIPSSMPKLNTITVNYENLRPEEINSRFFKSEGQISYLNNTSKIVLVEEEVELKNKAIHYVNKDQEETYKNLNRDLALEIGQEFLKTRDFDLEDMKLSSLVEEDGLYQLNYTKTYKDRYVENTYTELKIDGAGVREFNRLWLNVKDERETEIYIDTAPKSLLYLLDKKDYENKRVVAIDLCYYFDPGHEFLDNAQRTKEGKTIPAWRIEFSDGSKLIVDDY